MIFKIFRETLCCDQKKILPNVFGVQRLVVQQRLRQQVELGAAGLEDRLGALVGLAEEPGKSFLN